MARVRGDCSGVRGIVWLGLLAAACAGCAGNAPAARDGATAGEHRLAADRGGAGGDSAAPGPDSAGDAGVPPGDGSAQSPTAEEVKAWVEAYAQAHPGSSGDINAKSPAEIAADPDAQRLLALCGADQRPVIPILAWEYGGSDHPWINPEASALVYCVYIPVNPSTAHWSYDAAADNVTADMTVRFPEHNPCKDEVGNRQVLACIGDATNLEILVDTASLHDGHDVGLELSEASTDLMLVEPGGNKVLVVHNN